MREEKIVYLQKGIYDYDLMMMQIAKLVERYPFLMQKTIGRSVKGRILCCLTLGTGKRRIHVNGAHHANEWITSFVVMKSIECLCESIVHKKEIEHTLVSRLLEEVTYDFVPMVNPDGVCLCQMGLKAIQKEEEKKRLLLYNEGIAYFDRWKANIRGVDLNRNYNAGFFAYTQISEKKKPSYAYYAGEVSESEPESKALADLTRQRKYDLVLAYHTQGEVIYWTYDNYHVANDKEYATMFSEASGYALDMPDVLAASGGYKDWFIETFLKPGFTIECGKGENPIASGQGMAIVRKTLPILLLAGKDIRKEEY